MKELSLFTGAGGGVLGTKLLGFNHIGYVEINEYCQKIIRQRIEDGIIDRAPIFTDVREFLQSGAAREYRGFADLVTAGFPCQPFSVAGKGQAENDERNMWPETIGIIRAVRPRYVLLENVPGLLAHEYIREIFRDLAESGFNARWRVLSAAEMGAPHKRDRVFILCDSDSDGKSAIPIDDETSILQGVAANANSAQCKRGGVSIRAQQKYTDTSKHGWWEVEPEVGRVVNGLAFRMDRLKSIGNGQVPAVVKTAWELLIETT